MVACCGCGHARFGREHACCERTAVDQGEQDLRSCRLGQQRAHSGEVGVAVRLLVLAHGLDRSPLIVRSPSMGLCGMFGCVSDSHRWNPNGRAEGSDFQMWISRHDEYA